MRSNEETINNNDEMRSESLKRETNADEVGSEQWQPDADMQVLCPLRAPLRNSERAEREKQCEAALPSRYIRYGCASRARVSDGK